MNAAIRFITVLAVALVAAHAAADCAKQSAPKPFSTTIKKSYAPVHDGSGMRQPGCIVETANGQTGYVSYEYICRLPGSEQIELQPDYGCCDTGPDHGDFLCTVRVNQRGGLRKIRADGLGLSPTKSDPRAVFDLVNTLKGDFRFTEQGAGLRLAQHVTNSSFQKEAASIRPELLAIVQNKDLHVNKRGYAAYVLLQYPDLSEAQTASLLAVFFEMEPIGEVAIPMLKKSAALPKQADTFAGGLIDYLKRQYRNDHIAPEILNTLAALAPVLRNQLPKLLEFEYEWSDRGAHHNFKRRAGYWERMRKIACAVSAEDTNTLSRKDLYPVSFNQPFTCAKH
ncbi:MAG: hypothetical protein AAB036_11325 [Elusimicrobiota bacterium]